MQSNNNNKEVVQATSFLFHHMSIKIGFIFMESTKSYYLYELQERYSGQDWMSVIPKTYSIDGNGTMPRVLKSEYDEMCGQVDKYRWVDTDDYICEDNSYYSQYLTFESLSDDNVIYFRATNSTITRTISASTDNGDTWTEYESSTRGSGATIATLNTGERLLVKGLNPSYCTVGCEHVHFLSEKSFNVYGNIMSLIYGDSFINASDTLTSDFTFYGLFDESTRLVSAENLVLPAAKLSQSCYGYMFDDCTNLTKAPSLLPATTLASSCYAYMFRRCLRLTVVPELPATTLAYGCYYGMFYGCRDLATAPALPATTLATSCYQEMFYGCPNLTTAPSILPATTLQFQCYAYMFWKCTSLTTAPELPAPTLVSYCYQRMFYMCENLNSIKCLATDLSADNCLTEWVYDVATNGTFTKSASTSWAPGKNGIPSGWNVQNA